MRNSLLWHQLLKARLWVVSLEVFFENVPSSHYEKQTACTFSLATNKLALKWCTKVVQPTHSILPSSAVVWHTICGFGFGDYSYSLFVSVRGDFVTEY